MVERSKSERCPTRAEARPSYSIFVMMRRKKLMLASKISSLPSAIAFAERLRRDRFHDPEAIQIMDDVTHTVVDATADGAAPTEPAIFTPVASRPPRERMDLGATDAPILQIPVVHFDAEVAGFDSRDGAAPKARPVLCAAGGLLRGRPTDEDVTRSLNDVVVALAVRPAR